MDHAVFSQEQWDSTSPQRARTARPMTSSIQTVGSPPEGNTAPTDLQRYLSELDPLTVSLRTAESASAKKSKRQGGSLAEEVWTEEREWAAMLDDEGEVNAVPSSTVDDDDSISTRMYQSSHRIAEPILGERGMEDEEDDGEDNQFLRTRKLRMKAEKLIDHSFVQHFFIYKNTNVQLIQDLLTRSEQLFELIDSQRSGYVTFEAFTRLLIAIAPKHILRSDVLAFVQAQTNNMQDLVDYQEFIISGKVLLLSKAQALQAQELARKRLYGSNSLDKSGSQRAIEAAGMQLSEDKQVSSIKTWLNRQRAITGDSSTYTWKNHIEWYQKRKAQALIWLIRRATRALDHEVILIEAQKYLLVRAKQAKAMSDLLEVGRLSLLQKDRCGIARLRLLKRVMHARYFIIKVQRTHEYLKGIAAQKIRELDYLDRVRQYKTNLHNNEAEEVQRLLQRPKQADYANLYKVKVQQERALEFLRKIAGKAVIHTAKQHEVLQSLLLYGNKVQAQMIIKDRARKELVQRAEAAYEFLIKQDQVLLGLLRIGAKALNFMDRQTEALNFLLQRGPAAKDFLSYQHSASLELYTLGRKTLAFMNQREDAFAYLTRRKVRAAQFIARKAEAIVYLRSKPEKVWKVLDRCDQALAWLGQRAERARQHLVRRTKARNYLQVS